MKQTVTISLDRETVRKVKIIAARRATSISGLLAAHIDSIVKEDEAFERAKHHALAVLERGFDLIGPHEGERSELHDR